VLSWAYKDNEPDKISRKSRKIFLSAFTERRIHQYIFQALGWDYTSARILLSATAEKYGCKLKKKVPRFISLCP
jgi:hypothetical protein